LATPVLEPDAAAAAAAARKGADPSKAVHAATREAPASETVDTDRQSTQVPQESKAGGDADMKEQPPQPLPINGHDSTPDVAKEQTQGANSAATESLREEKAVEVIAPASVPAAAVGKRPLDDGRRDGDAAKMSRFYASHLTDCRPEVCGKTPIFDAPLLPVTLFLGNLSHADDVRLYADMEQYGTLERCFIMRDHSGVSKVTVLQHCPVLLIAASG
jgi:hypothetical protein